ncbi:3-oxoacyl-[acyl-carrier-protein] reductase isoform X1 [Balaenoptera acutorostrata]|uniref:3-ketoacyl-[acyl-carrier-protein] reductase beta subunit n=1 Tax=Balaenoptera acutorostrata TaxID=9767 RepID=A0A384AZA9_BALAC|nr:3-oxoacyl-[acyl-carrier-protein] reductase isoform X1 [Balaenoptera acutorostrata]
MDRVCAVFGGSRGIGRAVARLMAQRDYRLAIVARNLQGARAVAGDLGGDHLALSCDVAKEHDVQNTFEEIEKNLGRVNFLVNAAGINRDNLLVRTNAEDMLSQLHTNLLGSMLTCRAAVKTMIKQQTGSIVNVGSVAGVKGSSGQSVYSASKGGLVAFSRALAKEVARKKIRVNVVAPVRHHHQALLRGAGTGAGDPHCYSALEQRRPGGRDLGLTGLRGPGRCICTKTTRETSHLKVSCI